MTIVILLSLVAVAVAGGYRWHLEDKRRVADEERKVALAKAAAQIAENTRRAEEENARRREEQARAAKAAAEAKAKEEKVPAPDFQTFADNRTWDKPPTADDRTFAEAHDSPVVLTVETPASDVVPAPKPKRTRKKKTDTPATEA